MRVCVYVCVRACVRAGGRAGVRAGVRVIPLISVFIVQYAQIQKG